MHVQRDLSLVGLGLLQCLFNQCPRLFWRCVAKSVRKANHVSPSLGIRLGDLQDHIRVRLAFERTPERHRAVRLHPDPLCEGGPHDFKGRLEGLAYRPPHVRLGVAFRTRGDEDRRVGTPFLSSSEQRLKTFHIRHERCKPDAFLLSLGVPWLLCDRLAELLRIFQRRDPIGPHERGDLDRCGVRPHQEVAELDFFFKGEVYLLVLQSVPGSHLMDPDAFVRPAPAVKRRVARAQARAATAVAVAVAVAVAFAPAAPR
eukprot:CAMPEP_0114509526 /NCGR_PEP_ID=MMETSP0109-20121206/13262_1 /TAXON_ID=29199 /ORGANISM="Chlorarachnion reptans, Strain CCCM449" /LENGTH=257 /DNA_ID=CAMNT_0001688695 /DNA_START=411 /DNA_END=1185 /DNA_ORIENTATION=-